MKEDLIDIVMTKEFVELTETERQELTDWFTTQEEFDQMKQVFHEVERIRTQDKFTPKKETKESLDMLFVSKHSKTAPVIWYNSIMVALYPKDKPAFQRPLLQVAAIAVLLLLVYPFMNNMNIKDEPKQMAKNEMIQEPVEKQELESIQEENIVSNNSVPSELTVVESADRTLEDMPMMMDVESPMERVVADESLAEGEESVAFATAASVHPDGVFTGASAVSYSQSAAKQPAIFDLLTTTF